MVLDEGEGWAIDDRAGVDFKHGSLMGVYKFDKRIKIFDSSDEIALLYQSAGEGYILCSLQFIPSKHDYFDTTLS